MLKSIRFFLLLLPPATAFAQSSEYKWSVAYSGSEWYYKNVIRDTLKYPYVHLVYEKDTFVIDSLIPTKKATVKKISTFLIDSQNNRVYHSSLYIGEYTETVVIFNMQKKRIESFWVYKDNLYEVKPYVAISNYLTQNKWDTYAFELSHCVNIKNRQFAIYYARPYNYSCKVFMGDYIERIGCLNGFYITDTCLKEQYSGPLLWYKDDEIDTFWPGITTMDPCSFWLDKKEPILSENKVVVYPNPSSSEVTLQLSRPLPHFTLRLFDMQGRVLLQEVYEHREVLHLNLQPFAKGMYFLELQTTTGRTTTKLLRE